MKNLTLQEIEKAIRLCIENAKELLEEAEILFKKKHFARTYTLSQLAEEELAKVMTLLRTGIEIACEGKFDYKSFNQRLKTHTTKIKNIELIKQTIPTKGKKSDELKIQLKKIDKFAKFLNNQKNKSIYVGFDGKKFSKPSEHFDYKRTKTYLDEAQHSYRQMKNFEKTRLKELKKLPKNERLKNRLKKALTELKTDPYNAMENYMDK